ncbi:hypothetical protein XENTR_v10021664 [Xenopus tropicalis]|nr:hypothetical protein XENTR_v10021664 [Xenopus tropicalis]
MGYQASPYSSPFNTTDSPSRAEIRADFSSESLLFPTAWKGPTRQGIWQREHLAAKSRSSLVTSALHFPQQGTMTLLPSLSDFCINVPRQTYRLPLSGFVPNVPRQMYLWPFSVTGTSPVAPPETPAGVYFSSQPYQRASAILRRYGLTAFQCTQSHWKDTLTVPQQYAGTETECSSLSSARIRDNAHTQVQSNTRHPSSSIAFLKMAAMTSHRGSSLVNSRQNYSLAPKHMHARLK